MADNDSSQDRKLPASQRKIQKARAQGQVARSRDLGHFAAITAAVGLLGAMAPELAVWLSKLMADGLRLDAALLADPASMADHLLALTHQALPLLAPVFGAMLLAALASGVVAGGWNFSFEALTPDFSKLALLSGLRRLLSPHQLTQTLKACLLALLLGGVGTLYLAQKWEQHGQLLAMPLNAALAASGQLMLSGLMLLCGVLALFALVDVPLQRQLLLRRLRMTLQEAKKEMKEQEGNAEVKGQIRARMRELANKRMFAAVPLADLVVLNPTHYAVALRYEEATMSAPRVVAKGADLVALRIRDLARASKVPVLQAPALARALYAHTELDQEVPARLFSAVAQVLAWVFQLRDGVVAGRAPMEPPVPEVPPDLDPAQREKARAPAAGTPPRAAGSDA